jgi:hypothetical protein
VDVNKKTCIQAKLGEWVGSGIQADELVAIVRERILPQLEPPQVTIHKTMSKGGQKFQANPHYSSTETIARQHWALAERKVPKMGGGTSVEEIPVHLQCIVFLAEDPTIPIEFDLGTTIQEKGYHFLANTVDHELTESGDNMHWGEGWNYGTLAENNQTLIHMAKKKQIDSDEEEKRDALISIPIGKIVSGLVGVLDPNHQELEDNFYFFIAKHSKWGELFVEAAEKWDMSITQGRQVLPLCTC